LGQRPKIPLYDCFPLNATNLKILGESMGEDLTVYDLDFFLEADSES